MGYVSSYFVRLLCLLYLKNGSRCDGQIEFMQHMMASWLLCQKSMQTPLEQLYGKVCFLSELGYADGSLGGSGLCTCCFVIRSLTLVCLHRDCLESRPVRVDQLEFVLGKMLSNG
jgi:hypothetical protein